MSVKSFLSVALMLVSPLALASPVASPVTPSDLEARQGCQFNGPVSSFPPMSQWLDFSTIFDRYKQSMVNAGSTFDDVGRIAVAIEQAAANIGVEERVILAIILQESSGNVGVICTPGGDNEQDCGLMQCEGCEGFPGQNNLPQADTSAMVNGGTSHFKANLEDFGNLDSVSSIYPALREYNSGAVDQSNLSNLPNGFGVPCYVSDIARRLMGEVF